MDDLYRISITHPTNGQEYRYDPDYDCFYRIHKYDDANSEWTAKYGWIVWCVILTAVAFFVCVQVDPELKAWVRGLPPV
jgi:hypothetical protein